MIDLRDVFKRYGDQLAVNGVSLRAHPGEIFGLLGANGAGKTTTIRMIMNILVPDSGEVLIDGVRFLKPTRTGSGICRKNEACTVARQ